MGKLFCKNRKELSVKINGKKVKYRCMKCDAESPKEKWCCKPMRL